MTLFLAQTMPSVAASEWTAVALVAIGVLELLLTVAIFYVGVKASKIDKLEDVVTTKAEQVVDTRFRLLSTEFTGVMAQLRTVVDGIEKRLERGDDAFDRQSQSQQALEVAAEQREGKLRNWAMERFATRSEMTGLAEDIRKLDVMLAKFGERLREREDHR